jgi:predicted MFS family arabinose efflux permease
MSDAEKTAPSRRALWLVLLCGAGVFALTMGTRQTMGLFLSSLNTATGLGVASISLAFAFGQLWWGLTQPCAGAMADKVGTGMAGPAVLMSATARLIPPDKRGIATGVVNAGGSFGQFVMAPIAGALMLAQGWASAMQVLGLLVLLALPAAFVLKGNSLQSAPAGHKAVGTREAIRTAMHNPSFLLLGAGFFVCGFHVAFLATHLPGVIASCGLPVQFGAWSLALLGLFNIVGSLAMGWAVGRWRMKSLLSLVYAARAVAVLLFLLAPKTGPVVLVFAAVMGLTFLSTVPPTAGLVAKFFGLGNMATLFGIVMLSHQVGGFLGAWLGGKVFEATGSFDWIWYIDIVLAVGAALIHLPIREAHQGDISVPAASKGVS